MKTIFLVLSAMLIIGSVIPYIRDILRGSTKPNLVSWITWTLLTGVAAAAQISGGEYVAATFAGSAGLATLLVVLMGLRHGYVKYTRFDVICQVAVVVGIVLWQVFDSPTIGVIAVVIIDLIGSLPTIRHSWVAPGEETRQTYAIGALAGTFAVLALITYNWVSLPYALYIVLVNTVIVSVIIYRSRSQLAVVS